MLSHVLLKANNLLQSVGVGLSTMKTPMSFSHTPIILLSSATSLELEELSSFEVT